MEEVDKACIHIGRRDNVVIIKASALLQKYDVLALSNVIWQVLSCKFAIDSSEPGVIAGVGLRSH